MDTKPIKSDNHSLAIEKLRAKHRLEKAMAQVESAQRGMKSEFPCLYEWIALKMEELESLKG